jgi:hypothetical protein
MYRSGDSADYSPRIIPQSTSSSNGSGGSGSPTSAISSNSSSASSTSSEGSRSSASASRSTSARSGDTSSASSGGNQAVETTNQEERELPAKESFYEWEEVEKLKHNTLIGNGGWGSVYRGRVQPHRDECAIKFLSMEESSRQSVLSSFRKEIHAMCTIDSRNVMRLWGYSVSPRGNEVALIMPLATSTVEALSSSGVLHNSAALRIKVVHDAALGLVELHRHEILHLDIKLDNALISIEADGQPYLRWTDFGLASFRGGPCASHNPHRAFGTRGYIPPENLDWYGTRSEMTEKTDMFMFGIFVREIIEGKRLHEWTPEAKRMAWDGRMRELALPAPFTEADPTHMRLAQVAALCAAATQHERPCAREALDQLSQVREATGPRARADKPMQTKDTASGTTPLLPLAAAMAAPTSAAAAPIDETTTMVPTMSGAMNAYGADSKRAPTTSSTESPVESNTSRRGHIVAFGAGTVLGAIGAAGVTWWLSRSPANQQGKAALSDVEPPDGKRARHSGPGEEPSQ